MMTDTNRDEMATETAEIRLAWRGFERRLLTLVEAMQHDQDRLILEVGDSKELPKAEFRMEAGRVVARIGDMNRRESRIGRAALVRHTILLLRKTAGVPHPDLLTHRAAGPVGQLSQVLGLEWTGGTRPELDFYIEPDKERMLELLQETIGQDHEVGRDDDGDLFLDHAGQRIFVRIHENFAAIEIFTRVAHGARSRRQAAVEVGILNRSTPWIWWQVSGRDIIQTATVELSPFVPHHLMTTLEVFLLAMTGTRADLALRIGGEVA